MIPKLPFDIVLTDSKLCLKHLRERLDTYDHYKDRKYAVTFKLVVDNEDCSVCKELAERAYFLKLKEERDV